MAPLSTTVRQLDEHGRSHNRSPKPIAVANRRLGDVARGDYLVGKSPYILALVIADVRVELDAQDRGKHHRSKVFGIVARLLIGLAEAVMLRQVAVLITVSGNSESHRGGDQAMWLIGRIGTRNCKYDLARSQILQTFLRAYQLTVRRKNGTYAHQIEFGYSRIAQRQFIRSEFFSMLSHTLG